MSRPFLLRLTVTDDGRAAHAELEVAPSPAYIRRAAIRGAVNCLQEAEVEMRDDVASAAARNRLRGRADGGELT